MEENKIKTMTNKEYYLMVETMLTCVRSVFLMGKDQENAKICTMLIEETRERFIKAE